MGRLVAILAVVLSACASDSGTTKATSGLAAAVTPTGTISHATIPVAGRERTYRLYVPSKLGDGAVPLLIGLHGGGGTGDEFAQMNQVEGLAESNGFLAVHPDGVRLPGEPGGFWNAGLCCATGAAREDVDDVGFVDALITAIEDAHDVDADRVHVFGYSNGATMTYRLVCELADRVAAVALYAGTLAIEPCAPTQGVSVLHVHGDADLLHPIDGGVGALGLDLPPPLDGFDRLATTNRCPTPAVRIDGPRRVDLRTPCADRTTLELVTVAGADHRWRGGVPGYDLTAELVEFLLAHPRTT